MFHQVHTPRQEQDTSSKVDGDQDFWLGLLCARSRIGTSHASKQFLWTGIFHDQDTSGYLATVLARVRALDFPKLDLESEQVRAGAVESWMQLTGLKMSAVSPEVAEF